MAELVPYTNDAARVEVKQFLPNAYVVFHHAGPKTYNSLLVEMKNRELVLVDTPVGEKATQSLLSWIDYKMGPRKIVAILSSHRWDRVSGAGTLIQSGIPVFGSRETVALMKRVDQSMAPTLLHIDDARMAPPNHLFKLKTGLHLILGAEKVDVIYPGNGYVSDNVVVHFPESRLVFAGALVPATTQADSRSWISALKKVSKLSYEWVVPAEGRKLSPYLLDDSLKVLAPPSEVATQ